MKKSTALGVLGLALCLSLSAQNPQGPHHRGDGAAAWKPVGPAGGPVGNLVLNPANSTEVYALSGFLGQIFRSSNAGVSWKRVAFFADSLNDIALTPANPNMISAIAYDSVLISLNKGKTWTRHQLGKYNQCYCGRVYASPENPKVLIVTGLRVYQPSPNWRVCMAVFRSTDGGTTWTVSQFEPNTAFGYIDTITGTPSQPQILVVAGYGQRPGGSDSYYVYKSADGGQTWAKIAEPDSPVTGLALHPTDPKRMWYGSADGVFRTSNGGSSWERNAGTLSVTALTLDRDNPQTLYAGTAENCYKSTDGGISWAGSGKPPSGAGTALLADGTAVLYGSLAGIYRSTDGGTVFKASQTGFLASDIPAIAVAPSSPSTMYAASSLAGLYRSTNGGTTWKALPSFVRSDYILKIAVEPSDANRLYILVGDRRSDYIVYRSVNGGATWKSLKTEHCLQDLAVAPSNPKVLYGAGQIASGTPSLGVFMSKDGGTTWTSKRVCTVAGSTASATAVDPRNAKVVFLGGQRSWSAALFKSTNGGSSWTDVTGSIKGQVSHIFFDPKAADRIFVVTSLGLFMTTNGGTSWISIGDDFAQHVVAFHPTAKNTLYAGGSNGVSVSVDGGGSWTALKSGLTVKDVNCLTFNPSTKILYAGTMGGGIYKIQQ